MSHKTRSHYLITEKCAQKAANPTGDESWSGLRKNRRKLLRHKLGERDIKRLQCTARTTNLGILVARRTNVKGDQGSLPFKPIIQWRSRKCTGWRGRDAVGSQSTKAWKNWACWASRKPIKQHTDFTVITFKLREKEVGGTVKVSVRKWIPTVGFEKKTGQQDAP